MGEQKFDPVNWVIGVVVLLLAIFSAFQAYQNAERDQQQQDCIANIVRQQNEALQARSAIANQSDEATKNFLLGVKQIKTEKEFKALFQSYEDAQNQIKEQRKAHPYPPYPEGKCN